jgi:predicted metal-dependent phosphoesterase TrpH
VIKIDLHMHSGDDPYDGLRYTAVQLIDRAAELGFAAIAITLHEKVLEDERVFDHARQRGLLLIRAVEWTFGGRDVLLYNITQREVERLKSFDDLRAYRRERGDDLLVIAPHPFYPKGHSLGRKLERNLDVFDAVEIAQIHLSWFNPFNSRAVAIAHKHNKPVIANSDAHNLWMFGRHYTHVDAQPTQASIFAAIRQGKVEPVSPPVTVRECLRMFLVEPLFLRKKGEVLASFDQASK